MSRRLRPGFLLLPMCLSVAAQQYNFKFYGEEEGLQNLAVQVLLQDHSGFLWAGTQNGLFRYDGNRFIGYAKSDGLPGARIESLHESIDGTLWVGTRAGLARRTGGRFETLNLGVAEGILGRQGIVSDRQRILYLATENGLVIGTPQGTPQAAPSGTPRGNRIEFALVPSPSPAPVYSVFVESGGGLLYGCGTGLCMLDSGVEREIGRDQGLPPGRWDAILEDLDGNLWVRSEQALYLRSQGSNKFQYRPGLAESTNTYPTLALDPGGTLLANTFRGLSRETDHGWDIVDADTGLNTNDISSVIQDREGSVWLGLLGSGLARWLGYNQWQSWNNRDGLSRESVWSIARDAGGRLWIGTQFGLNYAAEAGGGVVGKSVVGKSVVGKSFVWKKHPMAGVNMIRTLAPAPDGSLWIGADPGGVLQLDPGSGAVRQFGAAQGMSSANVRNVMVDREGRVWVAARGGLFRSTEPGSTLSKPAKPVISFERVSPAGTFAQEGFFEITQDREGTIWVAGEGGLARFSKGQWTRTTTRQGLKSDLVLQIGNAPDGSVWIAYREALGISHLTYSNGRLAKVEHVVSGNGVSGGGAGNGVAGNGLRSDKALFLSFDSRGWLWAGTDHGVDMFDGTRWRHYGRADGLIWDDCNTNAFLADAGGSVWIGTSKGLSRFQPESSPVPGVPPPVVFTSVKFGDRELDSVAVLAVPYSANTLQVHFAALTFVQESNVLFQYRMAGVESRWLETRQRELNFPQLPPGSYTLEVNARNAQGVWSAEPARLTFVIQAPWWLTSWFRVLCGIAAALVGWWSWHKRTRRLQEAHQRLEAAVSQRTRELSLEKQRVIEEKSRAEQENLVVQKQKREIERLLRESQQSSRLKSEFLANMSHEIRTPMNGVLGMTDLLLDTQLTSEQRGYLEAARYSADSLLTVLNDILDFSKIEAGRLDLNPIQFPVREVLSQTAKIFEVSVGAKGLAFRVDCDPGVPELVVGDPDRLRQILLNLIGNAVKFTERGEIVVAVTGEATGQAVSEAGWTLRFSVRDTGIGIAGDKQELIFESFRQADGSTTRKYGGTGLGLAICKRLVEMMGGTLRLTSELGHGSTFSFTALFATAADRGVAPALRTLAGAVAADTGPPSVSLRILLAEDNLVNQRVASRLLEKRGHTVTHAVTGSEALARLKEEPFDVILMDVQMPDMDGLETTAIIREREKGTGTRTPIVALTAHSMKGDRERCLAVGMDDYVTKPVDARELIEAVEAVAAGIERVPREPAPSK